MKIICPNCGNDDKFYHLKDGRLKCSLCKKYFTPEKKNIHIDEKKLKKIIEMILKDKTLNEILEKIDISKFKLLKIKSLIREEIGRELKLKFKDEKLKKNMSTFEKCCCILEKQNKNFFNFLEKSLKGKGGIRSHNLKEIVSEYFWKFKNQPKSLKEKKEKIFQMVKDKFWFE